MADETKIKIDVTDAQKQLERLRQEIKRLNEAGDDNEKEVKKLEKEYDDLSKNLEKAANSSGGLVDNMAALPGPVGNAAKGVKGLTAAAKAFIATPVGAIITAIVGALALMKTALAASEEGQLKLAKVTGTLKGVMTGLKEVLVQVAPLIADVFSGNWGKITEDWNKVKDAFGNISNVAQQSGEIAVARQQLTKATAEWALEESKLAGELEKQRTISEDNSRSEAQRAAANQKVFEINKKMVEGNLKLKRQEIALTKQEQALASNTMEDNIALIELQTQEQNLINELSKVKTEYIKKKNQIAKKGSADAAADAKAASEEFEQQKKNNANLITLQKQRVDDLKKGSTEWLKEQQKLIQLTYDADVYAANGDETLLKIAEGKKAQAIKVAQETADAYDKAMKDTYDKLNNLVVPKVETSKWDEMRKKLKDELDKVQKTIEDSYQNGEVSYEDYVNLMAKLSAKRATEEKQVEQQIAQDKVDMATYATGAVIDSLQQLVEVNADSSEEMFNANKAFQIASATIEGLRAGIKIWADETAPTAVKAAETAALAATTAATIAKISQTKFNKSGATSSSPSSSISISKGQQTQDQNLSIISRQVDDSTLRTSVQTILVVDDVTAAQMKANKVKTISQI